MKEIKSARLEWKHFSIPTLPLFKSLTVVVIIKNLLCPMTTMMMERTHLSLFVPWAL